MLLDVFPWHEGYKHRSCLGVDPRSGRRGFLCSRLRWYWIRPLALAGHLGTRMWSCEQIVSCPLLDCSGSVLCRLVLRVVPSTWSSLYPEKGEDRISSGSAKTRISSAKESKASNPLRAENHINKVYIAPYLAQREAKRKQDSWHFHSWVKVRSICAQRQSKESLRSLLDSRVGVALFEQRRNWLRFNWHI